MKGRVAATAWIFSIALVVAFVAGVPAARAQGEEEACCQPGRIESAKSIIAQAETFKMRASKFHTDSAALIRDAAKLQGQAARLDPGARKQYEADLAEFRRHAEAYRAHQAQVEQTMGFCKATQAQYQAMLAEYSLHTAIFHIPTIRPPHVCESMEMDMASADKLNNQLRVDQDRINKSQGQLMAAEEKLIGAASHNAAADAPLQARARLLEAERQLTGEFAALKTEYDMLSTQHQALTAAGIKPPTLTKVTGKIQSKTSTK